MGQYWLIRNICLSHTELFVVSGRKREIIKSIRANINYILEAWKQPNLKNMWLRMGPDPKTGLPTGLSCLLLICFSEIHVVWTLPCWLKTVFHFFSFSPPRPGLWQRLLNANNINFPPFTFFFPCRQPSIFFKGTVSPAKRIHFSDSLSTILSMWLRVLLMKSKWKPLGPSWKATRPKKGIPLYSLPSIFLLTGFQMQWLESLQPLWTMR